MFPNPNGSIEDNPIPDKATVYLRFYEKVPDEKRGYAFAMAKDAKNAYLFCSSDHASFGNQMMLTIRYN